MNKTQKVMLVGLLASLPTLPAAHAQTITFDWTETGSSLYGDGAGTLTIDSVPITPDVPLGYVYQLTAFTGELGGTTITGLGAPFIAFFSLPSSPTAASYYGIQVGFSTTAHNYLLSNSSDDPNYEIEGEFGPGGGFDAGTDSFTLAPVPESAVNPGWIAAAGLFIGWRRWRSARAARA